ncbi:SMP-30/gluconolactonase/LRE family protein [Kozakia baliensis]|uniref:SMP-30/gluconolactonase/LRE family protein n=1 Tax=Kozakia baliensis TaxID=153496 RepID=UPI0009F33FDB|nr:SMP-30/gluconolactonase/LRE family protein [Kozakia baliensis]
MNDFGSSDQILPLNLHDEANRPRAFEPQFNDLIFPLATPMRLFHGAAWGEGPVWFGDMRSLFWSDIPNNRILRWSEETQKASIFRQPSNFANGNTRDRQGRLVTCEHETRRVTRTEHDGRITILAERIDDKRLNSPNDIVTSRDGAIWFTDPIYGLQSRFEGGGSGHSERPTSLYRIDPNGSVSIIAEDFDNPNGLCFSPDESLLYVIETGPSPHRIHACRLNDDKTRILSRDVLIETAKNEFADGLRCDEQGRLWCGWSGGPGLDGVMVFAPDGTRLGHIPVPERCANLCFGGADRDFLYIAAAHSLYRVRVNTRGVAGG